MKPLPSLQELNDYCAAMNAHANAELQRELDYVLENAPAVLERTESVLSTASNASDALLLRIDRDYLLSLLEAGLPTYLDTCFARNAVDRLDHLLANRFE